MTPVPRRPIEDEPSPLALVATQLATLQETVTRGFRELAREIAELRDKSVSQREYDRFTSELRVDWAAGEAAHGRDIAAVRGEIEALNTAHAKAQERADRNRKWLVGSVIAGVAALGTAVGAIAAVIDALSKIH